MKADAFGKSDPYCVVWYDGVEVGRTPPCVQTLDPVWPVAEACFALPPTLGTANPELRLELYDHDATSFAAVSRGEGDFLGRVLLRPADLLVLRKKTPAMAKRTRSDAGGRRARTSPASRTPYTLKSRKNAAAAFDRRPTSAPRCSRTRRACGSRSPTSPRPTCPRPSSRAALR